MTERCVNCGRPGTAHPPSGACPTGLTVTLSAESIARAARTEHPRLLARLLNGGTVGAFTEIHIEQLKVTEKP